MVQMKQAMWARPGATQQCSSNLSLMEFCPDGKNHKNKNGFRYWVIRVFHWVWKYIGQVGLSMTSWAWNLPFF